MILLELKTVPVACDDVVGTPSNKEQSKMLWLLEQIKEAFVLGPAQIGSGNLLSINATRDSSLTCF
jgi:hypothetical protein